MKGRYLICTAVFLLPLIANAYQCKNVPILIENKTQYALEVTRVDTAQSDINLKFSDRIKPNSIFPAKAWPTQGPGQQYLDEVSGSVEFDMWQDKKLIGTYKIHYLGKNMPDLTKANTFYCQFQASDTENFAEVNSDDNHLVVKMPVVEKNQIKFVLDNRD